MPQSAGDCLGAVEEPRWSGQRLASSAPGSLGIARGQGCIPFGELGMAFALPAGTMIAGGPLISRSLLSCARNVGPDGDICVRYVMQARRGAFSLLKDLGISGLRGNFGGS